MKHLHALAAVLLLACGGPPSPATTPCTGRLVGDVVVTEVMVDPEGTDVGHEYVELYNATGAELDVGGLSLWAARADGTQREDFVLPPHRLAAGGHLVLGDVREGTPLPGHVQLAYAQALGALGNTSGRVGVACGELVVDEVAWTQGGPSGAARTLDGARAPDALDNDAPERWCPAREEFAPGARGSPGRANAPCAAGAAPVSCTDAEHGTARPAVPPRLGELVISEVMADPSAAPDSAGEWLELHARADVDLNGLTVAVGGTASTVSAPACLRVPAGGRALLAREPSPALNGGLSGVHAALGVALANTGGLLTLRVGELEVDRAPYRVPRAGVAWQVDPGALDAQGNDAVEAACAATAVGMTGDLGTPGGANTPCAHTDAGPVGGPADAGVPADAGAAGCVDARTGLRRPPVPPGVGDVLVTELLADPRAPLRDEDAEWVEVLAGRAVDLNGLTLAVRAPQPDGGTSETGASVLQDARCLRVEAGARAVLARSADARLNGGLPAPLATFTVALGNTPPRTVELRLPDGGLLDALTYDAQALVPGDAVQVRPGLEQPGPLDVLCRPAPAYYVGPDGGVGRGTPGALNVCAD